MNTAIIESLGDELDRALGSVERFYQYTARLLGVPEVSSLEERSVLRLLHSRITRMQDKGLDMKQVNAKLKRTEAGTAAGGQGIWCTGGGEEGRQRPTQARAAFETAPGGGACSPP